MIETRLGEFEEVILLLVGILNFDAYAFRIADEFEKQTKRSISVGAVHSALSRLEDKGFLKSGMAAGSSERGGRSKRVYTITAYGKRALQDALELRMSLWTQYPAFASRLKFS
jgi:PadR family transcriptional regulator PadR